MSIVSIDIAGLHSSEDGKPVSITLEHDQIVAVMLALLLIVTAKGSSPLLKDSRVIEEKLDAFLSVAFSPKDMVDLLVKLDDAHDRSHKNESPFNNAAMN